MNHLFDYLVEKGVKSVDKKKINWCSLSVVAEGFDNSCFMIWVSQQEQ